MDRLSIFRIYKSFSNGAQAGATVRRVAHGRRITSRQRLPGPPSRAGRAALAPPANGLFIQYGLIAEEVAKVYPELVTRNATGEVEGVRYDEIAPLLLNELQHQQQVQARQQQEIIVLKAQNDQLQAALAQQNETILTRLAQLEAAAARTVPLARR